MGIDGHECVKDILSMDHFADISIIQIPRYIYKPCDHNVNQKLAFMAKNLSQKLVLMEKSSILKLRSLPTTSSPNKYTP